MTRTNAYDKDGNRKRSNPKKISELLADLFAERGYGQLQVRDILDDAWREIAGEALSSFSCTGKFQRGVLEITVQNSMILQELNFQKQTLLTSLQKKLPEHKVKDLRFRIG